MLFKKKRNSVESSEIKCAADVGEVTVLNKGVKLRLCKEVRK